MLQSTLIPASLRTVTPLMVHDKHEIQAKKTFEHTIEIYLKDSNAYTNTYFSRYFEWQGICRERWFHQCIAADFLQDKGAFVTKQAYQDYVQETFPFQTVHCLVNTFQVKQTSFHLLFRFFVDGNLVSRGYQQIAFIGHNKKIMRLPHDIFQKIREYEIPVENIRSN